MHQLMAAVQALTFRVTNVLGFLGSWRCIFAFFLPTRNICHSGSFASMPSHEGRSRYFVNAYALVICFVLGLYFPAAAQNSTVETLEDQAYIWMQRGREDKAAEVWRKLLIAQPQDATALCELAVHAVSVGALAEAKQRLRELKEVNPRDGRLAFVNAMLRGGDLVAAELREARLLSKAGRTQLALQHYRKAFGEAEPTTLSGLEYYQVLAAAPEGWGAALVGFERLASSTPKQPMCSLRWLSSHPRDLHPHSRDPLIAAACRHACNK
jgi:tetratricopeptide (TPR) repeat protein